MIDVISDSQPVNNYRLLIVGGNTTGAVDLFAGIDLTALIGRTLLIRNIEFIPRYKVNTVQAPAIQYLDEVAGVNNMDLVSPNTPAGTDRPRIITANVEFGGLDFRFFVNGSMIQLIQGANYLLNFDKEFKDINLYFPERIQNMNLYVDESIYVDVTNGTKDDYFLQVNFDCIVSPTKRQLYKYGII